MSQRLETDITLNLKGNLSAKAKQYGNSMSDFARKNKRAMNLVQTSTAAASKGIDTLGNRYVGMATAFATGATVKNVAAFESQMTRIGTNAKLSAEEVERLTKSIDQASTQKDIRIDQRQLASGVDALLGKTGDLEFVQNNLENMGLFMQAFGADAESSAALFAQFREKGVKDATEVMNTIDQLYGQFAIGSVNVKDLAGISEQLFSTYQSKGPEAITQMSGLVQLFAKTKGNANESLTSIQAVFAAFSDKKKVEFLDQQGIDVFKKGTKELREPVELLMEILDKAENDPMKLGSVFDQTSKQGLASLYSEGNKQLLLQMVSGNAELGATQEAAAKNAATFDSAITSLHSSFNKFANQRLADPIKEIADAINSVDDESIQNWLKWGETAVWAIGGLVAANKGIKLFNAGRRALGKGQGGSGAGGLADMGATPVYVVNMPAGGIGGVSDISPDGSPSKSKKKSKAGTAFKGVAAATVVYPIVDSVLDALVGDTDFGKWAKSTTLGDLFGGGSKSIAKEPTQQTASPYLTGNYSTEPVNQPYPTNQALNLKIEVADDRINVTQQSSSPGLKVDMDNGPN